MIVQNLPYPPTAVTPGTGATTPAFFDSNGAFTEANNGTSVTLNLPSVLVEGNLLIGQVHTFGTGGHVWPADWTEIYNTSGGYSWAYRYVDGTETAPTVTFAMNCSRSSSVISQWTDVDPTTPIGATLFKIGGNEDPETHPGFNTIYDNSLAVMFLQNAGHNEPGPATGWIRRYFGGLFHDNLSAYDKTMVAAGFTGSFSESDGDTFEYGILGCEIRGVP